MKSLNLTKYLAFTLIIFIATLNYELVFSQKANAQVRLNSDSELYYQNRLIDNNPKTINNRLGIFQLHNDGEIWQYTGQSCLFDKCSGWILIDKNRKTIDIQIENGKLYQKHDDGEIWQWLGEPCSSGSCSSWRLL